MALVQLDLPVQTGPVRMTVFRDPYTDRLIVELRTEAGDAIPDTTSVWLDGSVATEWSS